MHHYHQYSHECVDAYYYDHYRQLSWWNLALYALRSCEDRYTADADKRRSGLFMFHLMTSVIFVLWIIGARSEVVAGRGYNPLTL